MFLDPLICFQPNNVSCIPDTLLLYYIANRIIAENVNPENLLGIDVNIV